MLKSVQQNCSFAHPENVLLTMLGDSDKTIRSKAVRIIKKIRRANTYSTVRDFHLPKVDMDAESYQQLATITEVGRSEVLYLSQYKGLLEVTEPSLLKDCVNINQFIDTPLALYYPNHTQSVERGVKLTTESTKRISGQKRQIGEALCKIAARKKAWIGKNNEVTRKAANQEVNQ